jgi:protein-S-isoprenylcysteine O-methyltransferase Ste14
MKNQPVSTFSLLRNKKTVILFLKSLIFTLIVPGSVAVLVPHLISEGTRLNITWVSLFGIILICSGLAIYCRCIWDFITSGKGTPAPIDAPKYLVVKGLYHFTRNPMYAAVLLVILGWVLLYTSLVMLFYGIFVAFCFQMLIIFYEEPKLQQIFGVDYMAYKNTVNRWVSLIN